MADQKRIWRLGIDVGGTNTDAVVIDGDLKLVAATKSPTTEDVMSGIVAAMHEVITQIGADAARNIGFAMLGTTHCTNAIVERKRLNKVAALRVGAPATTAISCMADWPDELKNAMRVRDFLVHGGNEFDGREISALSEDEIREVARVVREEGFESVAVTSVFSPVSDAHEKRAAAVLREELGEGFPITLSSEIGSLGFLERENASILNAALYDVARTTADSFEAALASEGLADVAVYLGQNDGTLMSVDYAKRYPIFTIACGPTNSIRGASFLTQEKDAVVVDIGGTTTDVGVLAHGFPRESMVAVEIGDVRTNFRMPDLVSVGLGGGSLVRQLEDGSVTVGPDSVGYLVTKKARCFGGDTLTATDIVVAKGLAEGVGDPTLVADLEPALVDAAYAEITRIIEDAVDAMKTSAGDVTVILVGGGSILAPRPAGRLGQRAAPRELRRGERSGFGHRAGVRPDRQGVLADRDPARPGARRVEAARVRRGHRSRRRSEHRGSGRRRGHPDGLLGRRAVHPRQSRRRSDAVTDFCPVRRCLGSRTRCLYNEVSRREGLDSPRLSDRSGGLGLVFALLSPMG